MNINDSLPAVGIGRPTPGDGYMIVARDLLQGVEALSTLPSSVHPRSCALLAAHALECALKAFLWHKREKNLNTHDLKALWDRAHKQGLRISGVAPGWVATLNLDYIRYQEGKSQDGKKRGIVSGGPWPALIPMARELKSLIKEVAKSI